MWSKASSRVIRLSNEDCSSFLQQPPVEMDVFEDASELDLNEYEMDVSEDAPVLRSDPGLGYKHKRRGADTTGASPHTLHRRCEDVHGARETRSPQSEHSRYGFVLHAYIQL